MEIRKGHVYTADLNPRIGTEPGKVRPVVVVQTDLLNGVHPSTVICPLTPLIQPEAQILRVHLARGEAGLKEPSDILVDQVRAIDNHRFLKATGRLSQRSLEKLMRNLRSLLS